MHQGDLYNHWYGKDSDMLAFELLNEVTKKEYCEPWNNISNECIRRIRKIAFTAGNTLS